MIYALKIKPNFYDDIMNHGKRFEVRHYERPDMFKPGDLVSLREYYDDQYTRRQILVKITYVLYDIDFKCGIKTGYCVFGFDIIVGDKG